MKYVGIDVAGSTKDQIIAIVDKNLSVRDVLIKKITNSDEAMRLASEISKDHGEDLIIAIDAPRVYATGPTFGRRAEKELKRLKLANPIFTPPKNRENPILHNWMQIGRWLFQAFEKYNKNVIEVFPTAAYNRFSKSNIKYCIPVRFIKKKLASDISDAICAALTAYCHDTGQAEKIGDDKEGFIVIPKIASGKKKRSSGN